MYVGIYYICERRDVEIYCVVDEVTDDSLFEGTLVECEEFAAAVREGV